MSEQRKKVSKGIKCKSAMSKARPSAAIIEAKRRAAEQKTLENQTRKDTIYMSDIYQSAVNARTMVKSNTGLVYDRSMAEHHCLWDENYLESPERFTKILERCEQLGLIERCKNIEPRFATQSEILLNHSQTQIDILKSTEDCDDLEKLEELSSHYDAVYIHPSTYKQSLLACGSTINLLDAICRGEIQNGMAIIRPPGHHAMKSEYCGYCFFNNVAIGVEKMLKDGLASKILIVDWDVHHGQATQQMFYDDPRVVYFSIHRYENGEFWPNLRQSNYHYVGENEGAGYNFNVPLNKIAMTNADYLAIFQQLLLPMAHEFQPDLIVVSAGYDAALGCPEGEMNITPAFYAHLLSPLLTLARGRVAVVLEGGYCLESLAESAALTLRTLLGDPCPMIGTLDVPSESICETILNVIYCQRPYWKCYAYQDTYSIYSEPPNPEDSSYHLPAVIFKGDETKPEIYETRDCYPIQSETTVKDIQNRLLSLKQITNLQTAPHRVCLVYDDTMLNHFNVSDDTHPEKPKRISAIHAKHEEYDLLKRCHIIQGRMASESELLLTHTNKHIKAIHETETKKLADLVKQSHKLDSVYFNKATWKSACFAAGSLLQVVDSVLKGESQSGIAIIRPPGHHAAEDNACGFCIFNNISIAAKYATEHCGLNRVLVLDWDVHHGNGTQSILEEDPKILYMSIHRYDNGAFFPHSRNANYDVVGKGKGEGFTVNIPWNRAKMGDAEYIAAFQQVVMPIAYQFNPELVLISAGFDACIGDPLGGYKVSPVAYGHFTHWLSSLANGRLILALEGGYNINSTSYAMVMCTKSLLGDPVQPLCVNKPTNPCPSAVTSIKNVLKVQKKYWPNLVFSVALPKEIVIPLPLSIVENMKLIAVSPGAETKIICEQWQTEKNQEFIDLSVKMNELNIQSSDKYVKSSDSNEKSTAGGSSNADQGGSSKENDGFSAAGTSRQTLASYLEENQQLLLDGEMFAIVPLKDCPHLPLIAPVPAEGIDVNSPCHECNTVIENWICLHCYAVFCARNINQHAAIHGENLEHPLTLSFSDLSVWCYGCESYVDNPVLHPAKNAAYRSKFNEELPWTYSS